MSLIEAETGKERKIAAGLKVQRLQAEVILWVYIIKVQLADYFHISSRFYDALLNALVY